MSDQFFQSRGSETSVTEEILKTMHLPGYYGASYAQVHKFPQSHCDDNWDVTLLWWFAIYVSVNVYKSMYYIYAKI